MSDKHNIKREGRTVEPSQKKTRTVVSHTCGEGTEGKSRNGDKSNGVVVRASSEDVMKVS